VKYSVLNESKQLFASKYQLYLPTREELINEIEQAKLNYKLKVDKNKKTNGKHCTFKTR